MKDLFKSIERLCRSGKTQVGSKAEGIIVLGGLSKKFLKRSSYFALKRLSIYSLTKSFFFQYDEGLNQINWAPM